MNVKEFLKLVEEIYSYRFDYKSVPAAQKEKFPPTKPNEYFVNDLISCEIIHKNGTSIGNVISVDNFGAGDLLETIYKNKKIYIPLDDNVLSVDLEKKIILVDPIKGIIDND